MITLSYRLIAGIVIMSLLPLAAVFIADLHFGIRAGYLTRDITVVAGIHPLTGALSSLGILLWWTSATVWLFSAFCYYKLQTWQTCRFALVFGLLSAYLAFDDLFQFHELLAPKYFGVSERSVFKILIFATFVILIVFRNMLLRHDSLLLALALTFLGSSVVVDTVPERWLRSASWFERWIIFLEDGLKWLGIFYWVAFSIIRCVDDVSFYGLRKFQLESD